MRVFIILALAAVLAGCAKQQVNINPYLTEYKSSKTEINYLKSELTKISGIFSPRDLETVKRSQYAIQSVLSYLDKTTVNSELTSAEAKVIWQMVKSDFADLVQVLDAYRGQYPTSLAIIYDMTRRNAYSEGAKLTQLLAGANDISLNASDLAGYMQVVIKNFGPLLLSSYGDYGSVLKLIGGDTFRLPKGVITSEPVTARPITTEPTTVKKQPSPTTKMQPATPGSDEIPIYNPNTGKRIYPKR